MITYITWGLVFCFGALFGSFFALCVHRIPRELSIVRPASRCEGCQTSIPWYHNIPIVSYLLLRGHCRNCGDSIGIRNWLIEIGTALFTLLLWFEFGPSPEEMIWFSPAEFARSLWPFLAVFSFFGALLVASLIDLETMYLPNVITLPGIPLAIVLSQALPSQTWIQAILGAAVGFLSLGALRLFYRRVKKQEGVGLGDVYLIGTIGGFIGLRYLPVMLLLASIQGSIVGLLMAYFSKRASQKESVRSFQVPFGPFLSLGAIEVLFFGETLTRWYLGY